MKLAKLQNVVNRKASIINEIINKVDALGACESTCHECTLKDDVDNFKEYIVIEKKKKKINHEEGYEK